MNTTGFAPPPPKKKTSPWRVVLIILGSLLAIVAVIVASGALFVLTAEESVPSDSERALLIDANAIMQGQKPVNPVFETAVKTTYFDDSYDLVYRHEDPAGEEIFVEYSVTFETKRSDTLTSYTALWASSKVSLATMGDLDVVEPDDGFTWGDASHYAHLKRGELVVGTLFVARKQNTIVYFVFAGWTYDDPALFAVLVEPFLTALDAHKPLH